MSHTKANFVKNKLSWKEEEARRISLFGTGTAVVVGIRLPAYFVFSP
jgi:hypothetical protein